MISEQDLYSPHRRVSVRDPQKRSPGTISVPNKRSVGKISVRDLLARSLYRSLEEVSWQDLLGKTSKRDLLARSLDEISVPVLYQSSLGKIYSM